VGTPTITSRHFNTHASQQTAKIICAVLNHPDNERILTQSRQAVQALVKKYPIKD
jgi:glycine/serine hydroxymethyltransferase